MYKNMPVKRVDNHTIHVIIAMVTLEDLFKPFRKLALPEFSSYAHFPEKYSLFVSIDKYFYLYLHICSIIRYIGLYV